IAPINGVQWRHKNSRAGLQPVASRSWGNRVGHRHVSESVLKTSISELRAALSDEARQPRFIETASRFGYRFISPGTDADSLGNDPGGSSQHTGRTRTGS